MESNIDAAEWKLEVERVLPLLKVHIRTDNKVTRSQFCHLYIIYFLFFITLLIEAVDQCD